MVGLGFKIGAVPDAGLDSGCLSRRAHSDHRVSISRLQGRRFHPADPFPRSLPRQRGSPAARCIGLLLILASATLLFGNLAAIPQTNFKRLLAYSSIAHAGFLMLALAAGKSATADSLSSGQVVSFYLATYLIMTLGVFFILAQVRIQRDGEMITDFNGLGKTNPILALALTVLLAALAGVPLTAGFIGKFFVFSLAVEAQLWVGVGIAFIAAAAGFYYYLNIVRAMWWATPGDLAPITLPPVTSACVAVLTVATLVFGICPQPILALLQ